MATHVSKKVKSKGSLAKKIANLRPPGELTDVEIIREMEKILAQRKILEERPPCTLEFCDGKPHDGAKYFHEPRRLELENPLDLATRVQINYRIREHLTYISNHLTKAIRDVEQRKSRQIAISVPPRMGKSQLAIVYFVTWVLSIHPDWRIGNIAHDTSLASLWGRQIRRLVEDNSHILGINIARDAGAVSEWETTAGGGVVSRSMPGQSITGRGFKVLLIDDPVKDFASAHSETYRQSEWEWWINNALTRLEPPSLTVVIGTRWHEDDFIGRILSPIYTSDRDQWEIITLPAIAEKFDLLGRAEGDPLFSPLIENESRAQALSRWETLKTSLGSYSWESLYQQHPSPAKGEIFDLSKLSYWTRDPHKEDRENRVIYFDPEAKRGTWVDSWDCAFNSREETDGSYVVGQRWVRVDANRFLVAQKRGHFTFTRTIREMEEWAEPDSVKSPYGSKVHKRLIEAKANGAAVIDTLKDKISGIKPIIPIGSKEARARVVTPEMESGNVFFPSPSDPGNEWVSEFISELRNFPHGRHDDQVDAMTQALSELREVKAGGLSRPPATQIKRDLIRTIRGSRRLR